MSIEGNPANTGSEANGTTAERAFDALLRLTNLVNRADAGVLSSFALTPDDADQRTQVIREDGNIYTYSYDAIGQLTNASAALPDGTPWPGYQFSYTYDATGNPIEQNKNGLIYFNSFNNLNQNVDTIPSGTLTAIGTYSSPLTATVTVNNVQAQLHDGDWAATGIPFAQGTNVLLTTIQDLAGRSSSVTSTIVVADRTYAYDANGNMTTNGAFTYVWDCENRLTEVWKNGTLVQRNRYDGLWRRREKIEYSPDGTATTNRYIYKDLFVLAITDGSENFLETYRYGSNLSDGAGIDLVESRRILSIHQESNPIFIHYDYNGSVGLTSSDKQDSLAVYNYTPYGEILSQEGGIAIRYLNSSKEYDVSSTLYHYEYRDYSAQLGRFTRRDPIVSGRGINRYTFSGNDPVGHIDWLGLADTANYNTVYYDVSGPFYQLAVTLGPGEWGETRGTRTYRILNKNIETETESDSSCSDGCRRIVTYTIAVEFYVANLTVRLPNWTGYSTASSDEKVGWDARINTLVEHEQGHVNLFQAFHAQETIQGIGSDCLYNEAKRIAKGEAGRALGKSLKRRVDENDRLHNEYDLKTNHGADDGIMY